MAIFGIHLIYEGFPSLFPILQYQVCIVKFILNKEDNFLNVSKFWYF